MEEPIEGEFDDTRFRKIMRRFEATVADNPMLWTIACVTIVALLMSGFLAFANHAAGTQRVLGGQGHAPTASAPSHGGGH